MAQTIPSTTTIMSAIDKGAIHELKMLEQKTVSFDQKVGFVIKNTFLVFDDDEHDCNLCLARMGRRQMSEPPRPIKSVCTEPIKFTAQDIPLDPAGPEPEPEASSAKGQEEEEEEELIVKDYPNWDRLGTGERWGEQEEAEEPEEIVQTQAPRPAAQGPEAVAAVAKQRAQVNPAPLHAMPWGAYSMFPYPQDGYGLMAVPCAAGMGQVFVPTIAAKPAPSNGKEPKKRLRRRAGCSLVDVAKKRMQEVSVGEASQQERPVEEGAGLPHGSAASSLSATSPRAEARCCATCNIPFAAQFKFCHHCGGQLQVAA